MCKWHSLKLNILLHFIVWIKYEMEYRHGKLATSISFHCFQKQYLCSSPCFWQQKCSNKSIICSESAAQLKQRGCDLSRNRHPRSAGRESQRRGATARCRLAVAWEEMQRVEEGTHLMAGCLTAPQTKQLLHALRSLGPQKRLCPGAQCPQGQGISVLGDCSNEIHCGIALMTHLPL